MEMNPNRLIIVLGMHRSGTSAITRGLIVAGVSLGDSLRPAVEGNNDKGFWEDRDFNNLNIQMLDSLNSDWHHVSPIKNSDIQLLKVRGFFLRATELIQKKMSCNPVYGVKDPRMAKLMPFWRQVFSYCNLDVSYVIAIRNPLSVSKSLEKRDNIVPEKSFLLWLGHVISSLSESIGTKRLVIDYDQLMLFPDDQLKRLANHLELRLDQDKLDIYKTNFLDNNLQHSIFSQNDLTSDCSCPPFVQEIYKTLIDVSSDRLNINSSNFIKNINDWSNRFGEVESCLRLVDIYDQKIEYALENIRELKLQSLGLSKPETDKDIHITNLEQKIKDKDVHNANLEIALINNEVHITNIDRALIDKDIHIVNLDRALIDKDVHIKNLDRALIDKDVHIANLNLALIDKDVHIKNLNQATKEHQLYIRALVEKVSQLEIELNKILKSNSWIITKPLRALSSLIRSALSTPPQKNE